MDRERSEKIISIFTIAGVILSIPAFILGLISLFNEQTNFWRNVRVYAPLILLLASVFFLFRITTLIRMTQTKSIWKARWKVIVFWSLTLVVFTISSITLTGKYFDVYDENAMLNSEYEQLKAELDNCYDELGNEISAKEACQQASIAQPEIENDPVEESAPSSETSSSAGDQVLKYSYIKIGIFDIGDSEMSLENKEYLDKLGFDTELISLGILEQDLKTYDVVYFSSGWCSQIKEINDNDFSKKMESYRKLGGGILIGDPEPIENARCELSFIPFSFYYEELNQIPSYEVYIPCKNNPRCSVHWIVSNIDEDKLPIPDTKLVIPDGEKGYYVIARQFISYNPSIVISATNNEYWVLLPGSEPSSGQRIIDTELMENIILWLAQERPFDGEREWYDDL